MPDVSTLAVASSSINEPGGTRPPVPTIVAAGNSRPPATLLTPMAVSVVTLRLVPVPPGRTSLTEPVTDKSSSTDTVAVLVVAT